MRYGSVCSGIEAVSVAWAPLGWEAEFFSEIERLPCEVLAHHYGSNLPGEPLARNGVPNLGDMTKFKDWPDATIDVLVGGTPCQSLSVAGLRAGLADPRGNLMLTYLAIAAKYRPRWVAWENVPGVLSSNGGRDFGTFLRGLGELGYGFAYRVLDAQYVRVGGFERAVPQRRKRVFVVGYLGDWRRAAAVFFDGPSLRGDSAPSRQAGQGVAPTISARPTGGGGLGTHFDLDDGLIHAPTVSPALKARDHKGPSSDGDGDGAPLIVHTLLAKSNDSHAADLDIYVTNSLRADGFDAGEDGTGRGTPLVPVVAASLTRGADSAGKGGYAGRRQEDDVNLIAFFDTTQTTSKANRSSPHPGDPSHPLSANAHPPAIAFAHQAGGDQTTLGYDPEAGTAPTLSSHQTPSVHHGWAVRRLTPLECERLQGFPDGYTSIMRKGKPAADGPRYKALGNSMAVNAMRWIGERIAIVDAMTEAADEDAT